ncbi:MAG: hypothetical protein M0R66_03055 [Candidatus Omnitrophica bacterium]|nr:hypothetical protein [Candidatus Omnitrophota bacterium]
MDTGSSRVSSGSQSADLSDASLSGCAGDVVSSISAFVSSVARDIASMMASNAAAVEAEEASGAQVGASSLTLALASLCGGSRSSSRADCSPPSPHSAIISDAGARDSALAIGVVAASPRGAACAGGDDDLPRSRAGVPRPKLCTPRRELTALNCVNNASACFDMPLFCAEER